MRSSTNSVLLVLAFLGALFFFYQLAHERVGNMIEDITYRLDPSPARALSYGEAHFNSKDPSQYDVDRAEYFFHKAALLDPTLPYLYHELARIEFLKGNFPNALSLINLQIALHGDKTPNSYYIRGLIEGFAGDYDAAARDYAHFLEIAPPNWAAINDYAWVLLKSGNPLQAASVTGLALNSFPHNAWLLNTNATALYEIGDREQALVKARAAVVESRKLGPADWLLAYPGNDPRIAESGIGAFKAATLSNMHTIELAAATSTVL